MRRSSSSSTWLSSRFAAAGLAAIVLGALFVHVARADDALQTIRDDVRDPPPPSPSSSGSRSSGNNSSGNSGSSAWDMFSDPDNPLSTAGAAGALLVAAAPFYGPIALLRDNWSEPGRFPRAPYEDSPGYINPDNDDLRLWSARFDAQYGNNGQGIDSLGGHFLLDSSFRLGLEASGGQLQQHFPGGVCDRLAIGDANVVFRFAQAPWAEFRTGLGANWMSDRQEGNVGFNFTYSADFFPRNPWIISTVFDGGTLGHAGLFRFRLTGGVVFHGVEAFAGYENLDIGRTDINSVVTGLRFWF
jgi:hypothetical protein